MQTADFDRQDSQQAAVPHVSLRDLLSFLQAENAKLLAASTPAYPPAIGVDEHETAKILGMSVFWLRKDRRTKRIIPFYRIGDRIVYSPERIKDALGSIEEGGAHLKSRSKKVAADA